jgi:hypothetical protein
MNQQQKLSRLARLAETAALDARDVLELTRDILAHGLLDAEGAWRDARTAVAYLSAIECWARVNAD